MIEVVTTEVCITVRCFYFEYAVTELEHRHIVCTSTAVEDHDFHILVRLIESVCQCGSSWFINDTAHIESSNFACLFSSLSLCIVEVCRNGDDSVGYFLSEIILCCFFHFLQNDSRYLLWCIETSVNIYARGVVVTLSHFVWHALYFFCQAVVCFSHEALDRVDGFSRVGDCLALRRVSHFALSAFHETDYRWRSAFSFSVRNNDRFISFHNGNT